MYTWCKLHNYRFKIYRTSLIDNLHVNFSKFEMVRKAMIEHPEIDYFVMIDADVVFSTYDLTVEALIHSFSDNPDAKVFVPMDIVGGFHWTFVSLGLHNTSINSGFMIWRRDSIDLITKYVYVAQHTSCGHKIKDRTPNDQLMWDKCFKHFVHYKDFSYIPWELVGIEKSRFIYQIYDKNKYVRHTPTVAFTDISHQLHQTNDVITLL